jgi:GNAT superfamily N-acetyltransferase
MSRPIRSFDSSFDPLADPPLDRVDRSRDPGFLPGLRVRPGRPADAPALEALQRRAARELAVRGVGAPPLELWVRALGARDQDGIADGTCLVAVVSGVLAGCGGWSGRRHARGSEPAWLRALFVEPCFARRGVGRALLEAAERAAAHAGHRLATLDALPGAEPFYRRAGYRCVGPLAVALPGGVRLPLVRMEKALDADVAVTREGCF